MHIIALLLLIGARAYHCPGGADYKAVHVVFAHFSPLREPSASAWEEAVEELMRVIPDGKISRLVAKDDVASQVTMADRESPADFAKSTVSDFSADGLDSGDVLSFGFGDRVEGEKRVVVLLGAANDTFTSPESDVVAAFVKGGLAAVVVDHLEELAGAMRISQLEHVRLEVDDFGRARLASLTATGGYDSPEAQLHALMQAGLDPSIGWTPPGGTVDGHNVLRIIGLSTDAVFHEEGDAAFLGPNDGDATVDCAGEDYPSVTQMAAAVAAAEAALLFEVVDFVSSDYTDLLDSSDLPGTVVSILEDSSNIANAIKEGVDALCA
eukprot:Polyplicarium_translucidae@DN1409_c0_g1_i5.p1